MRVPQSHAASFARLSYISAWLKRSHPAVYAAALLNSQPMGFYAPAQLVRDAREHGVAVLPIDVERSGWDMRLEGSCQAAPPDAPPSSGVGPAPPCGWASAWSAAWATPRANGSRPPAGPARSGRSPGWPAARV